MTGRGRRFGLLGLGLLVALAAAVPAFAAINPTLDATTQASGTTIGYAQGAGDDPPASSPSTSRPATPRCSRRRRATRSAPSRARPPRPTSAAPSLELSGDITAALATTTLSFAGATVPVSTLSVQCTGTATHTASGSSTSRPPARRSRCPAYVDDIPLTSTLSSTANTRSRSACRRRTCPPAPPAAPRSAPRSISANLNLTDVFSAAPGWYLWHVIVTPYNAGKGTPNAAGTLSAQSFDRTPQEITLAAKSAAGGKANVSRPCHRRVQGRPRRDRHARPTARVARHREDGPGGRFKASVTVATGAPITATAVAGPTPGKCQQGWFPVNCVTACFPSFTVTSEPVSVS